MITHKQLAQSALQVYDNSTISNNQVEATIQVINDEQILAIRGTQTTLDEHGISDIIRDLVIVPMWFKSLGLCHSGFGSGALSIINKVYKHLDITKPVYVTGHSAGGIISLMVAKLLSQNGYDVREWVGFGTPRGFVGKRKFAFKLTSYKHGKDIVTFLPPAGWFGYCNQVAFTNLTSSYVTKYPNAKDHKMTQYLDCIC